MNRFWVAVPLISSVLFVVASPLLAEDAAAPPAEPGLVLDHGLWEFEVSTTLPMQTRATRSTEQRCINKPVTPSALMPKALEQACTLKSIKLKKQKLSWRVSCTQNGQTSQGRGEFKGKEKQAEGKVRTDAYLNGQRMTLKVGFEGKWLRACTRAEEAAS